MPSEKAKGKRVVSKKQSKLNEDLPGSPDNSGDEENNSKLRQPRKNFKSDTKKENRKRSKEFNKDLQEESDSSDEFVLNDKKSAEHHAW